MGRKGKGKGTMREKEPEKGEKMADSRGRNERKGSEK